MLSFEHDLARCSTLSSVSVCNSLITQSAVVYIELRIFLSCKSNGLTVNIPQVACNVFVFHVDKRRLFYLRAVATLSL